MSWGLIVKDVFVRNVSKDYIDDNIRECENFISRCKEKLLMLASSTPHPILEDGENINWIDYVHSEINEMWGFLLEMAYKKNILEIAKESETEEYT